MVGKSAEGVNMSSRVTDRAASIFFKTPESSETSRRNESTPTGRSIMTSTNKSQVNNKPYSKRLGTPSSRNPTPQSGNLVRSTSIPTLLFRGQSRNEDGYKKSQSERRAFSTRLKSGVSTPSNCSTPLSKQNGSKTNYNLKPVKLLSFAGGEKYGKQTTDQKKVEPIKRYFSEENLKLSATPDCFSKVHMETPISKSISVDLPNILGEETSNLTVGIRVRPLNSKELTDPSVNNVVKVNETEVTVLCESGTSHTFTYDHCFWSCDPQHTQFATQLDVFSTIVQPLVDKAFDGYNACLFAYGQTGSGKSYSMMGIDVDMDIGIGKEAGIIPRFCYELFERIASLEDSKVAGIDKPVAGSAKVEVSYFEIYNEKIHDLLGGSADVGKRAPLKVREHPKFGPYVVDLSVHGVKSYEDFQGWLKVGNSQRATAATGMNEKSSRSHSIFSVILTQSQAEGSSEELSRRSKINLVDLAGSERLSQTCASGNRLREGVSINRSLLTLGKVIAALAENANNKKKCFVPYRESVLTWLLRESLGGNSRTTMLATISPASCYVDETLATLRYACQARTIVNRVRVNEDPHDRMIRDLRAEVERLRTLREDYEKQLREQHTTTQSDREREVEILKERLQHSEEQLKQAQRTWQERLQDAECRKSEELKFLQRCGVAVQLRPEQQQPCLLNLVADPLLSGTLLYLLPPGVVHVGRQDHSGTSPPPDIVLNGPLVRQQHCFIYNEDGELTLSPGDEGETFVNGELVTGSASLHHGDRVVIGGSHYFRVCNPKDCKQTVTPSHVADYEYAHEELLKVQEKRLYAELELAKKKALLEIEETRKEAENQLGAQRNLYESKLKLLGLTLEEQSKALVEEKKKKHELEIKVLEKQMECKYNRHSNGSPEKLATYESNFLEDMEAAINETATEAENILRSEAYSGTNLHEMQMMVQEATQRCRDIGINYEFHQQQQLGKTGLEPLIKVKDCEKHLVSLWKPGSFISWLNKLRDYNMKESIKELLNFDEEWEEEDDEDQENSLNASRISVNTKNIKRQLNESILQLSLDSMSPSSSVHESPCLNTSDSSNTSAEGEDLTHLNEMNNCVCDMEDASKNLRELCTKYTTSVVSSGVVQSLDMINDILNNLRTKLHLPTYSHETDQCLSTPSTGSCDSAFPYKESPTTKYFSPPSFTTTPVKSNLRSPFMPENGISRTPKAVRFLVSDDQHNH